MRLTAHTRTVDPPLPPLTHVCNRFSHTQLVQCTRLFFAGGWVARAHLQRERADDVIRRARAPGGAFIQRRVLVVEVVVTALPNGFTRRGDISHKVEDVEGGISDRRMISVQTRSGEGRGGDWQRCVSRR